MNKPLLLLASLCICSALNASCIINMGGTNARLDTLVSYQAGPGAYYTQYRVTKGSKVRTIYVMDIDLNNPYNTIEVRTAKDKLGVSENLDVTYSRLDAASHRMISGINCTPYIMSVHEQQIPDQFDGLAGYPAYGVCANGWPAVSHTQYDRGYEDADDRYESGYIAIDTSKTAFVNDFYFHGTLTKGDFTMNINELNRNRKENTENRTTVYNYLIGTTMRRACREVVFATSEWKTNRPMECTVTSVNTTGGTTLTGNQGALQGINSDVALLENLNVGDTFTMTLYMEARDGSTTTPITQMAGAYSLNMFQGVLTPRNTDEAYSSNDYARPMMAVDSTGKHLWLLMMQSPGMSTAEGCYILRHWGAYNAAAFDGGGSTQMMLHGDYVLSSTDAGGKRALPVSLWYISTAPDSEDAGRMEFIDPLTSIPAYASYTPTLRAWTAEGALISHDYQRHTLHCEPATLGTISEDGHTFTANPVNASGLLVATYGTTRAETPIEIRDGKVQIILDSIVLGNRDYEIQTQAIAGNIMLPLSPKALNWSVLEDETPHCSVSADGVLHGESNGRAMVVGSLSQFSDTLSVIVELASAPQLSTANSALCMVHFTLPMDTTFAFSATRNASITLSTPMRMWGNPDSVLVIVNTTSPVQSLEMAYRAANAQKAITHKLSGLTDSGIDYTFRFAVDKVIDTSNRAIYPLTLESLKFGMKDPVKNKEYQLTLKDIILCYRDWSKVTDLESLSAFSPFSQDGVRSAQKIMVNGQLYLLLNGHVYTPNGSLVR